MRAQWSWFRTPFVVLCGVLVMVLAACGVPVDDKFREARPPKEFARPPITATTTIVTTTVALASTVATVATSVIALVQVPLYFVRVGEGRLVALDRPFPDSIAVQGVLNSLLAGPSNGDPTLRTVADFSTVASVQPASKGVANVTLTDTFSALPSTEQRLAIGQLVLTLTGLRGVGQVKFMQNGFVVGVPLPDGQSGVTVAREDVSAMLESSADFGAGASGSATTDVTAVETTEASGSTTTSKPAVVTTRPKRRTRRATH